MKDMYEFTLPPPPHCGEKIDAQTLKCRRSQKWETSDCLGFDYEDLGAVGYYYHHQFFLKLSAKIYMMPLIY